MSLDVLAHSADGVVVTEHRTVHNRTVSVVQCLFRLVLVAASTLLLCSDPSHLDVYVCVSGVFVWVYLCVSYIR